MNYQGVVDNGTFAAGDAVARGDVMVVMGEQLSFGSAPVGTGASAQYDRWRRQVLVNGVPIPMYYSSYGQLAFQIPSDAAHGTSIFRCSATAWPAIWCPCTWRIARRGCC